MRKITTLDNISEDLVATDLFEVVDISDDSMAGSGTNKNISASQLANGLSRILSDRVSIVTSTSDNAVLISQSGGGNALLIRDEADDTSPFVVNGIGNVGIGTQLPTEKLDVIGIVKATGFVGPLTGNSSTATALASPRTIAITGDITGTATSFDGTSNITISSSITAGSIVNADINPSAAIAGTKIIPDFGSQSITATGNLVLTKGASDITTVSAQTTSGVVLNVNAIANTEGNIRTATNHPLTFSTNNAERARISSSGNVVIGKPNSALSTAIDSGSPNPPPTLGVYAAGISSLAVCGRGPTIRSFGLAGTIDEPLANADGTGIGGIVAFPWNGSSFTSYGSGGTAGIALISKGAQTPTNGGTFITLTTTQENTVGAVERVRIDHNGNVGIGTTSPTSTLHVNGTVTATAFKGIPCFAATGNAVQPINVSTDTKINILGNKLFDTTNSFTNNRFTAPISGYYHFDGAAYVYRANAQSGVSACHAILNKNGVRHTSGNWGMPAGTTDIITTVSNIILLNAGDYVELFVYATATTGTLASGTDVGNSAYNRLSGHLVCAV